LRLAGFVINAGTGERGLLLQMPTNNWSASA
jgi:hypothetical protein